MMTPIIEQAEPAQDAPVKAKRRRRRRPSPRPGMPCHGRIVGRVIDCANVEDGGRIFRFLQHLTDRERGFALRVLLDGLRATTEGGAK